MINYSVISNIYIPSTGTREGTAGFGCRGLLLRASFPGSCPPGKATGAVGKTNDGPTEGSLPGGDPTGGILGGVTAAGCIPGGGTPVCGTPTGDIVPGGTPACGTPAASGNPVTPPGGTLP